MTADPRSRQHLLSQLGRAHVICLVYSISAPSSFDRVAEYWLPLFRKEGINVSDFLVDLTAHREYTRRLSLSG